LVRVDIGGLRLFIDVEGLKLVPQGPVMVERPTIVLIHGGPGSDHTPFKPRMSPLSDVAQLVYVDLRGSGRSDRGVPTDWEWDRWGDDIAALCTALEIEDPVLLGTSCGGWVALSCALDHPGLARGLILDSAVPSTKEGSIAVFERTGGPEAGAIARRWFAGEPGDEVLQAWRDVCIPLYNRRSPEALSPEVLARVTSNPDVINRDREGAMRPFWPWATTRSPERLQRPGDVWRRLSEITCPTLVLAGNDDPMCAATESERLVDVLVNARVRFERYADCGHGVFREVPEEALAATRDFLSTLIG
jgi:proline iminopeptidase